MGPKAEAIYPLCLDPTSLPDCLRSALACPPTTDLGPDEIVRRDHELDLHRLRQTEYRACLRLHHSNHMSRLSPAPEDPMQVDVPR
jgi:hypothetical protein